MKHFTVSSGIFLALWTTVLLAEDPALKKDKDDSYGKYLTANLKDMSSSELKELGEKTDVCKELTEAHVSIIQDDEEGGKKAYLNMSVKCLADLASSKKDVFNKLAVPTRKEKQEHLFETKDKYMCVKIECFKGTDIYPDLEKYCKLHKVEPEKPKPEPKVPGNDASINFNASKASIIAILAIAVLFY